MASGPQRRDEQAPIGFDRDVDRHERVAATVLSQQRADVAEAGQVVADAALGQQPALVIDERDVMMTLGPVDPAEDLSQRVLPVAR